MLNKKIHPFLGNPVCLIVCLIIILVIIFFITFVVYGNNYKLFGLAVIFTLITVPMFVWGYEYFRRNSLEEKYGSENKISYAEPSPTFLGNIGYRERPEREFIGGLKDINNVEDWAANKEPVYEVDSRTQDEINEWLYN